MIDNVDNAIEFLTLCHKCGIIKRMNKYERTAELCT